MVGEGFLGAVDDGCEGLKPLDGMSVAEGGLVLNLLMRCFDEFVGCVVVR